MPHKRNPVGCAAVLTAAVRVPPLVATLLAGMVQEHERALGGWQAEWDTLPQIAALAAGALRQMREVVAGLQVDAARMRANLDLTHGLITGEAAMLELGGRIGRLPAHHGRGGLAPRRGRGPDAARGAGADPGRQGGHAGRAGHRATAGCRGPGSPQRPGQLRRPVGRAFADAAVQGWREAVAARGR